MHTHDVAIVGLGTAGAAAAALCAQRGLTVIGFDRGPLDQAGARWVNGVTGWCFDKSGISRSTGDELRGTGDHRFHLIAGWTGKRVVIEGRDVLDVDMRMLVDRLQSLAWDAGAEFHGDCSVRGWDGEVLATDGGDFRPHWVVDASGIKGAGLVSLEPIPSSDMCTAAHQIRQVTDVDAALAWCAENGAAEGENLCFTGVAGGYSIVNVHLHGEEVSILTGSMANEKSGTALLEEFVASQAWIGGKVFGGARAIPVGMPRRQLGHGKVALIGDSAGQVYASHGSGIGVQLVAARLLADTLAAGRDPASYSRRWWRRYGASLVVSARFARFSRSLSTDQIETLIASGLMSESMCRATMEQRSPHLTDLPPVLGGAMRLAFSASPRMR